MKELLSEEKSLLLKDLCARLPYGTFVQTYRCNTESFELLMPRLLEAFIKDEGLEIKPYLRPISSMTEEEEKEYKNCYQSDDTTTATLLVDFYNKKMFDYRGLIEKGLALDCTNLNIY